MANQGDDSERRRAAELERRAKVPTSAHRDRFRAQVDVNLVVMLAALPWYGAPASPERSPSSQDISIGLFKGKIWTVRSRIIICYLQVLRSDFGRSPAPEVLGRWQSVRE